MHGCACRLHANEWSTCMQGQYAVPSTVLEVMKAEGVTLSEVNCHLALLMHSDTGGACPLCALLRVRALLCSSWHCLLIPCAHATCRPPPLQPPVRT
jgi:hypothetical protein